MLEFTQIFNRILKRQNSDTRVSSNDFKGKVKVTIVQARNLIDRGTGRADPYVVLKSGSQGFKTKPKKRTLNPEWNEEFVLFVGTSFSIIKMVVWDCNRVGSDEFMGKLSVPISSLPIGIDHESWYKLEPAIKGTVAGEIRISFFYSGGIHQSNNEFQEDAKEKESGPKYRTWKTKSLSSSTCSLPDTVDSSEESPEMSKHDQRRSNTLRNIENYYKDLKKKDEDPNTTL